MPRIYAENEEHACAQGYVDFVAGVAAMAAGSDTAYFAVAARNYTIDTTRHALEVWDYLTVAQLDALYAYLGGTVSGTDSKYAKVRKIETSLSTKYIAALTVASAAATDGAGKTKITITNPGTATYFFKSATTTAPAILYGDTPDSTWKQLTLVVGVADEVVPNAAANDKYTVVRVTAGGTVDALASGNLTVKAGG